MKDNHDTTTETGVELINRLRLSRPDIAIDVKWDYDEHYVWDGDGPEERGLFPFVVTVTAMTIRDGRVIKTHDCIGGCYSPVHPSLNGPHDPEVHGYLFDLVSVAMADMDKELHE